MRSRAFSELSYYNTIQYFFISTHTRSLQKKERENNLKIKLDYRYRKEKPKKKLTGRIREFGASK